MTIAANLDKALRDAGLAVDGVSIGNAGDKKTWRVDFRAGDKATAAEKATAASVIAAFDPAAVPAPAPALDVAAELAALKERMTTVETAAATLSEQTAQLQAAIPAPAKLGP